MRQTTMHIYLSVLISFSTFIVANGQEYYTAKNRIVKLAQETSLYANNVDWEVADKEFSKLSNDKEDTESLKPALQYLINELGDKHATIRSSKDYSVQVSYTGPSLEIDIRNADYVNKVINNIESKFTCVEISYGEDIYGMLKIVGIGGQASVSEEAKAMQECIEHLKSIGVNQWFVDLRNNGGGNMNPMLAGMSPLLGNGFVGGAMDGKDSLVHRFEIKNFSFYDNERLVFPSLYAFPNPTADSVVVLTSKYTASSGEIVAVAFKGRPNTIFIGEETAGYTTGNGYQPITDELIMCISQNHYVDRNLKKYTGKVDVDMAIPFVENINELYDDQVLEGIDWLLQRE